MNTNHRKPLPGTSLDYFDARAAIDAISPGAYDKLSYTARVHAENLLRKADPAKLTDYLKQLIERKRASWNDGGAKAWFLARWMTSPLPLPTEV